MNAAEQIVRDFFNGFTNGDVDVMDQFFDPNVEYTVIHPETNETNRAVPWAGRYQGLDQAKAFIARLLSNITVTGIHADDLIAQDNRVAVFGRFYYTAQSTGNEFFSYFAIRIEVANGKITKYHFYEDTFAVAFAFRDDGYWTSDFANQYGVSIPQMVG